jgi:hypothetical protein
LPCWKGVWQSSVFDEDYNPLYVKGKSAPDVSPLDFLKCTSKAPIQVICLIQCAGLWFVGNPAKVSITWNLKQAIVRKPKTSTIADDTCFLTVRPADREVLKALPETELEQNDNTITAAVEDSDDEEEYRLPPPAPVTTHVPVSAPVVASSPVVEQSLPPAPEPTPVATTTAPAEEPKKKAVVRKVKAKE